MSSRFDEMSRPRTYDDELRRRLLALAAEVVAIEGPGSVSLRALAKAADTSTSAIYAIFGSKDDLMVAVLQEAAESLGEAQRAALRTDDSLADFAEMGRIYRRWALDRPALFQVMFGRRDLHGPLSRDQLVTSMAPVLTAVERCIAEGVLRDVDPRQAAISIWSAVHGAVSLEIAGYLDSEERGTEYEEHLVASAVYWMAS